MLPFPQSSSPLLSLPWLRGGRGLGSVFLCGLSVEPGAWHLAPPTRYLQSKWAMRRETGRVRGDRPAGGRTRSVATCLLLCGVKSGREAEGV